jgi:hypothetical protein
MFLKDFRCICFGFLLVILHFQVSAQGITGIDMKVYHDISSHDLLQYAEELSSEKYAGRLSGSPGYLSAANLVSGLLHDWGLKPGVGDSSYYQWFLNPWTDVLAPGKVKVILRGEETAISQELIFPDEFYPGSNSAKGSVSGEVVYAGFGISAPELGYDDYENLDVNGKIVLIESGLPYTRNDSILADWEKYSYHRYKFTRASELGAAGLLYAGLIANPNTRHIDNFVYAHISEDIAGKITGSAGRNFNGLKQEIISKMKPASFVTNSTAGIEAVTQHHQGTHACNVVGIVEGTDSVLKYEAIIIGAHLDGVGSPGMLFPGALDNASGVANLLGAARALALSDVKPARTVIFIFFGGEECGLLGSLEYVGNPLWPKAKTLFMINLDMVGNGTGFHIAGGKSHPGIFKHFEDANKTYLHRELISSEVRTFFGRPRTDGAVFENAGFPTLGLWTTGTVKPVFYHHPLDNIDGLTPEIMEDAAKLLYVGILGVANDKSLRVLPITEF